MIKQDKIKKAVELLIEAIGEDPAREGLLETPDRIARSYAEIFGGLTEDAAAHLKKTFPVDKNELIIERDIVFYSMCEHHFLPFFGRAHIAYIPDGKVAGLSKLARVTDVFARRPQIQEQMTNQIADTLERCLSPQGVMVIVEAEHLCMTMRGVKKPGAATVTTAVRGVFRTDTALTESVLRLIGIGDPREDR